MTLGEKVRQLRLGLGMTQKELAGDRITRNMLSQIESGAAQPSMKTLQYLAERLGVSAAALMDPMDSASVLDAARRRLRAGDPEQAIALAEKAGGASEERRLLLAYAKFLLCVERLKEGRIEEVEPLALASIREYKKSLYYSQSMHFKLLAMLAISKVQRGEPAEDLIHEAKEVYKEAAWESVYHILLARDLMKHDQLRDAEQELWKVTALPDRERPLYWITHGEIAMRQGKSGDALACFKRAEETEIPGYGLKNELYSLMEKLYKDTEDYQNAYLYASKQRELSEKE